MRYYAIRHLNALPFITAEFLNHAEADMVGTDGEYSYSEQEMLDHPDLREALERWRNRDDEAFAVEVLRQMVALTDGLRGHVEDVLARGPNGDPDDLYVDYYDGAAGAPITIALQEFFDGLEERWEKVVEACAWEGRYGWDGPESRATQEARARADAQRDDADDPIGASA